MWMLSLHEYDGINSTIELFFLLKRKIKQT